MLGPGWAVRDLTSLPDAPNVEETGATFAENAALKALAISRLFAGMVLADDSGLAVDALGGDPGVRSARFAGEDATDAQNRCKLIDLLKTVPAREFPARFRCEMVLANQGKVLGSFSGTVEGIVVPAERGQHEARGEYRAQTRLQRFMQDIGRVRPYIGAVIPAPGPERKVGEVVRELLLGIAPGKVGVRLGKPQLGQPVHQLGPRKRLREEDHLRLVALDGADEPLPEIEGLGVRVVDPENLHTLGNPEIHDALQFIP